MFFFKFTPIDVIKNELIQAILDDSHLMLLDQGHGGIFLKKLFLPSMQMKSSSSSSLFCTQKKDQISN